MPPESRGETTKLPSERYPDARIEVESIDFAAPQACPCCGEVMKDSGMSETAEYVDVRAKEYIVVEQRRAKHRCARCHGSLVTAPAPARITSGGSYSDELMIKGWGGGRGRALYNRRILQDEWGQPSRLLPGRRVATPPPSTHADPVSIQAASR